MDRNTRLALVLSFAVMFSWMMYQSQFEQPPGGQGVEGLTQGGSEEAAAVPQAETPSPEVRAAEPAPTPSQAPTAAPPPPVIAEIEERTIEFEKPLYTARFTTRGAALSYWELRGFDTGKAGGHEPIVMTARTDPPLKTLTTPFTELGIGDLSTASFEIENQDESSVTFRHSANGVTVRKLYVLEDDSYTFRLRIEVENGTTGELHPEFKTVWPAVQQDEQDWREASLSVLHEGGVERTAITQLGSPGFFGSIFGGGNDEDPNFKGEVDWAGIDATYFLGVVIPDNPSRANARITTIEKGNLGQVEVWYPPVTLPTHQKTELTYRAYLGPKETERLETVGGQTVLAIDQGYSWIEPLVKGFGWLLRALYSVVPNYGVAIILLTIFVRLVTMPLTNKQMRSMERMRQVQPKLKELQEKYADDRQKQSEEMMKLYRSEGVNPLGGCFPMLLQLPVFIGLFFALRSSIQLRQAPFMGWIDDLSAPETLFTIPGIDLPIRVLPLVMGLSMVVQQKITPQPTIDPAQARMMMTIMPIMMTVLFYQFPSGLVLYWFVSNILAIAHQLFIGRKIRASP